MSLDPTLRIGDADREHVVAALGQHLSLGHLTMNEFENRVDIAYTARTRGELDVVLADLPTAAPPRPLPQPPWTGPSTGMPWRWTTPWVVWTPWALTGAICLLIWVATSLTQGHPLYFWPLWVIGPWGVGLLTRAALARTRPSSRPQLATDAASLTTTQRYLHPDHESITAAGHLLSAHLNVDPTGARLRVV
jgi:hypothetical protein